MIVGLSRALLFFFGSEVCRGGFKTLPLKGDLGERASVLKSESRCSRTLNPKPIL